MQLLERDIDLRQPQFLALVEDDVAAQAGQQQHFHPGEGFAVFRAAPARKRARRVMVLERPAWPADTGFVRPFGQRRADQFRGQVIGVEEVEPIGGIEMGARLR